VPERADAFDDNGARPQEEATSQRVVVGGAIVIVGDYRIVTAKKPAIVSG
jgi:hypothetical protein